MNQITTQAGYNGHFENAVLNTNASYERRYLQLNTTQQDLIQTLKDIDLFSFEESTASRLVINYSGEIDDIKSVQNLCEQKGLEISSHQEFDNQIHHLYIEKNKQAREVPDDVQMSILGAVQTTLSHKKEASLSDTKQDWQLLSNNGYSLEKYHQGNLAQDIQDVSILWKNNFAMQDNAIWNILQNEIVFVMRYKGRIIGICMLSDNESTERAIHNEHQHKGLMKHLIHFSHSHILTQDPEKSIYAECRRPFSYKAALGAGMEPANRQPGLLCNNVSISGEPDEWNIDGGFTDFRTFIPMYISPEFKANVQQYQSIYQNS